MLNPFPMGCGGVGHPLETGIPLVLPCQIW